MKKDVKVAVMGCAVNGPGEAREADVGVAGGDGEALLFKKGKVVRKIPQSEIVSALLREMKKLTVIKIGAGQKAGQHLSGIGFWELSFLDEQICVGKIDADRKGRKITIHINPRKLLSKKDLSRLEEKIKNAYRLEAVEIFTSYPPEWFGVSYFPEILEQIKKKVPCSNGFFTGSTCELKENRLEVFLSHGGYDLLKTQGCEQKIREMIRDEFGIALEVSLSGNLSLDDSAIRDFREAAEAVCQNAVSESAKKASPRRKAPLRRRRAAPLWERKSWVLRFHKGNPVRDEKGDRRRGNRRLEGNGAKRREICFRPFRPYRF
jgi:hypothetical protein